MELPAPAAPPPGALGTALTRRKWLRFSPPLTAWAYGPCEHPSAAVQPASLLTQGGSNVTTDQQSRQRALVDKLLSEYKPGAQGSSVDTDRIRSIVIADPDLAAEIFPALLRWNLENAVGIWGLLFIVAMVYEKECSDDSLSVLLRTSAHDANVALPSVLSYTPHDTPANKSKVVELQMAEADVRAGDAHRVLTTMKIEGMSNELRERVMGNCIISFPASNDPRPIQRIPEIRRFVADLHQRMRYFPDVPQLRKQVQHASCIFWLLGRRNGDSG